MKTAPISPVQALPDAGPVRCHHCGDECLGDHVVAEDLDFCCHGCSTVYAMLQDHALTGFYDLQAPRTAGKGRVTEQDASEYAWLDDPAYADRLHTYRDDTRAQVTFRTPSMYCAACIWLLEKLHKFHPGILRADVDFPRREVTLQYKPEAIRLSAVAALLAQLGYPPELNLSDTATESGGKTRPDRRLWYALGIAGFCFGNIMLLSFPEYLQLEHSGLQSLFRYLNLLLAIPVVTYSARPWFKAAWQGLRRNHISVDVPISLGITILFGRSVVDILTGMGPGYMDALTGLVFFLLVGQAFQRKSHDRLHFERGFGDYFPVTALRLSGGAESHVPVAELAQGDVLRIRPGELVPADATLLRGTGHLDYSFVTGESQPVSAREGSRVYAGGRQVGRPIEVRLESTVAESELPRLWSKDVFREGGTTESGRLTDRIARVFTPAILLIAAVAGVYWALAAPEMVWNVVTAVLIIACPCALALTTPFAYGNIVRIFARRGFYLKGANAVERLAGIDTIVFDKTGTLTAAGEADLHFEGAPLSADVLAAVAAVSGMSLHPLSRKVAAWCADSMEKSGSALPEVTDFEEVPGAGIVGTVNGKALRLGRRAFVLPDETAEADREAAGSEVCLSVDGHWYGRFRIENHYRTGIPAMLQQLGEHFRMHILSGDQPGEAARLRRWLPAAADIRFRQSPDDKLAYVQALEADGQAVLMVGDGLNDAGALKTSRVGIAMVDDIASFSPASDAVLLGDQLVDLPAFIRAARATRKLVYAGFALSFLYNLVGLAFAVTGNLSPLVAAVLMPVSSVSIILFTVIGTNLLTRTRRSRQTSTTT